MGEKLAKTYNTELINEICKKWIERPKTLQSLYFIPSGKNDGSNCKELKVAAFPFEE